jgi:hypothetical protein
MKHLRLDSIQINQDDRRSFQQRARRLARSFAKDMLPDDVSDWFLPQGAELWHMDC